MGLSRPFESLSPSLFPRTDAHGFVIGKAVDDFAPCARLPETPLTGAYTRLEIFDSAQHAEGLCRAFLQDDGGMWTYMPVEAFPTPQDLSDHIRWRRTEQGFQTFVILDETSTPSGMASFMRHDLASGVVEIGFVSYAHQLKQTRAATEAQYLMMKHAFDHGYRRYEWKCDQLNRASNLAALRLGFTFEGVFRNAQVLKGRRRDTAWYAVIVEDWPRVRQRLEAWLRPDNFDSYGRQKVALTDLGF